MKALIKFKIYITILFIVSLIGSVGLGIYFWKTNISKISIKNTNLNIRDLVNSDVMKTINFSVDYFFTFGDYAEITSYDVKAGFDLKEQDIEKVKTGKNMYKYIIHLPVPKILNIDSSDKGLIISDVANNEEYEELSSKFRIYGEKHYAKQVALKNDILNKANRQAIDIFNNFSKQTGAQIEVVTSDVPEYNLGLNSFISKRYPLEIKYPNTFKSSNVNDYLTIYAGIFFDSNNDNIISIYPAYETTKINDKDKNKKYLFNSKIFTNNKIIRVYFENIENNYIVFKFLLNNKLFAIKFVSANNSDLLDFTPMALNVVYNISKLNSCENDFQKHDIYGITKKEWLSANISDHKDLIENYFFITDYRNKIVFLKDRINNIPVLTDKGASYFSKTGEDYYRENSKKCKNELDRIIEHLQENYNINFDDAIFILFDYNKAHRNRYLIFFKDEFVFFTPERGVWKIKEDEIFDRIKYSEIFTDNKISHENDEYCFGDNDKCIDGDPFSYVFDFLKEKGFISLFNE